MRRRRLHRTSMILGEDGSAIVFNLHTGRHIALNPVAAKVWQRLQRNRLEHAIAETAGEYRVPASRLRRDIEPVLELLRKHRMGRIHDR